MVNINSVCEGLLNQFTAWTGSEQGGGILFGSLAPVVALIVGLIGKRLLSAIGRWWRGDNLPVREFVQSLISRMGHTTDWETRCPKIVGEQRGVGNPTASVAVSVDGIWVGTSNIEPILNKHERKLIRQEAASLLVRLDLQKVVTEESAARDALMTALARKENPTVEDLIKPDVRQDGGISMSGATFHSGGVVNANCEAPAKGQTRMSGRLVQG